MAKSRDQLQGSLDLLVLKTLEHGPMHGWGITLHIERVSDATLRVEEGRCTRHCTGWSRRAGFGRNGA